MKGRDIFLLRPGKIIHLYAINLPVALLFYPHDSYVQMITSNHKFINKYPIDPSSKKLILGTIHPHDHGNFKTEFFYGNSNALWLLLSDAFPTELSKPITLEGILQFLCARKISISDTILKCGRPPGSTSDHELKVLKLNHGLIPAIKNSAITEIFFTSGFGKNNAFKLFYEDILKQKITKEIRDKREFTLDPSIFGRPVKMVILYSPSGAANIAFAKNKIYLANKHKYRSSTPVSEFKIEYYRQKFSHHCFSLPYGAGQIGTKPPSH